MGFEWKGESLNETVARWEAAVQLAGTQMAQDLGDALQHAIEANTPVETTVLRDSYEVSEVEYKQVAHLGYTSIRWSAFAWTGRVYTEVYYAPFVEYGTGLWGPRRRKYKIEAKPGHVLAFSPYNRTGPGPGGVILDTATGSPTTGDTVYRRFVMHPGSPGQAMFRLGAVLAEHEKQYWQQEALRLLAAHATGKLPINVE